MSAMAGKAKDCCFIFVLIFIEFVTILLLFYVLAFWLQGIWGLSSLTKDQTHIPCVGRQSLNHWTAREVPGLLS